MYNFFSANTLAGDKKMLRNTLNVHTDLMDEKYLGLSLLIGKNKCIELRSIKERMQARIHSWSGKVISQVGKAILIKSVAQAILIHMMSFLLFPKGFIQEVNMLLVGF